MATERKKVDSRIRTLLQNGVQSGHRTFFVIVGDRGKDQVVNLHLFLSKARVAQRPSVLWCYKKELGFSSHRKKRIKLIKKQIERGIRDADKDDPFELFISSTDIRYTYYKETHKILGNTYGMCVLQDFEAITPNILARTIETVEGGGIVVLLLRTMNSLKQLYTMTMDVHSRYRTEAHSDVVARFNERFILSLGGCQNCLVVDDELNVLPISLGKNVKPLPPAKAGDEAVTETQKELKELKESLKDTQPVGTLVNCARTLDQAKALLTFIEAISEKTLRSTVALTAARGRGKSAALGIAMASAVAYGYSNIFVTSPSPENLKTLFEFIFKGFDALGYEEHLDYDIVQSTNPDFNKAIVRVNIFRNHRQTIQYIQPQDSHVLGQAELVVIDEAAAIPLPYVKALLGPYLVFMASTINGYEGTGRSLSLKLIQQLREQSQGHLSNKSTRQEPTEIIASRDSKKKPSSMLDSASGATGGARVLREVKLEEPIRYSPNDPIELWLNKLLCLDAAVVSKNITGCPHPSQCQLYYVNRDTLFSYHPVSEAFLQRMMALYVSSHYKNTPNDLQLLSDAPAHHLFVLLPPVDENDNTLPDPLVVLQVCLEGEISQQTIINSLRKGYRADGDLIPWCMSQQYQDEDFGTLSGARVVRIATHPDYTNMGYGSRALKMLEEYYSGKLEGISEDDVPVNGGNSIKRIGDVELRNASLKSDLPKIRDPLSMPPLLSKLGERPSEKLHWLGVSYGLTPQLHKFWKKLGYVPLYLRQTMNELTGEHTCVMLKSLKRDGVGVGGIHVQREWLDEFARDFHRRIISLLGYDFSKFPAVLALSVMQAASMGTDKSNNHSPLTASAIPQYFSSYDLKRLESYANHVLDYHVIIDMVPTISQLYFSGKFVSPSKSNGEKPESVHLSAVQSSLLLGMGLQKKGINQMEKELNLPSSQLMALFMKIMRKVSTFLTKLQTSSIAETLNSNQQQPPQIPSSSSNSMSESSDEDMEDAEPNVSNGKDKDVLKRDIKDTEQWDPLAQNLDDDLDEAGGEVMKQMREKQRELINSIDVSQFAISNDNESWETVLSKSNVTGSGSAVVSIKNTESTKKRKLKDGVASELAEKEAKRIQSGSWIGMKKKKGKKSGK
ncbi:putative nucleolar ATPase Kre33 [Paraphysoderma sedebokerense]|nr:putative nucleolar ATPase Kre33 [Paraphysoderma sedebokerense]